MYHSSLLSTKQAYQVRRVGLGVGIWRKQEIFEPTFDGSEKCLLFWRLVANIKTLSKKRLMETKQTLIISIKLALIKNTPTPTPTPTIQGIMSEVNVTGLRKCFHNFRKSENLKSDNHVARQLLEAEESWDTLSCHVPGFVKKERRRMLIFSHSS